MSSSEVRVASSIVERMRHRAEEHARRMRDDPEYRAEHDRREEEALAALRRQAEWEADRRRQALERTRAAHGIPKRLWALIDNPATLDDTQALEAARAFLASDKTLLVLAGGVGPGKTVAGAWAAEKRGGIFVKAIDLTRTGTYDEERWDELRSASVLIIDDLGTEPRDEKGWAAANFEALVDHRYDWERPTILTTNLPFDAFKARYLSADGGRLYDRFREVGEFVEITDPSRRKCGP